MPTLHSDASGANVNDKWLSYQGEIYKSQTTSHMDFNIVNLEAAAQKVLDPGAFWYAAGNAGQGATTKSNREEFDKYAIIPRMMESKPLASLETKLFGVTYPSPLILAPIGLQAIYHAQAEEATASAAKDLKIPFTLSTAASRSIEAVAKANGDSSRWFQLYWTKSDNVTISLLKRAKATGYSVLVVTLDVPYLGWRPHDLQTAYLPFIYGYGDQVGFSDPVFMAKYPGLAGMGAGGAPMPYPFVLEEWRKLSKDGREDVKQLMELSVKWLEETDSRHFWGELQLLKDNWDGPIVLKGIQTLEDAEHVLSLGIQGIVVSNHGKSSYSPSSGGRQVDGALASLSALQHICTSQKIQQAQSSGKFTVLFDSGIRSGSDIVKAMALGAQGVMLGRPYIYGLALGGKEGVKHVIHTILADLALAVANASVTKLWRGDQVLKVK